MKKIYFLLLAFGLFTTVNAQIINFPDANFKAKLLQHNVDTNADGEIDQTEAATYTLRLNLSNSNIHDLSGIEYFVNINELYCSNNQLTTLTIGNSQNRLRRLKCDFNQLETLNINTSSITSLYCGNNRLTNLDISASTSLTMLSFGNNPLLTSVFLKNGGAVREWGFVFNYYLLEFAGNPNLQFICEDVEQVSQIQEKINEYGYTNCHVNSYCSFTPGGLYSVIKGDVRSDANNDGCDGTDLLVPNFKLNVTDSSNSSSIISNASGIYSVPVVAGTYTITPVLENSSYFNVSPSSVNVSFPTDASPFTQNFCLTANGIHPDLEVSVFPIKPARPGIDVKYSITYKNKGNTTQSGTVNLSFNDDILDLVAANPIVANQTVNNLSWNFTNLLPFERRQIVFTLNVNSPMETPPVNGGDILTYTATISSPVADETPNDNTFTLNQTVFNAYDPNDKTCLEGTTITPDKAGEYIHYMIRFENTGTANALNIVVKDIIDTAKFDVSSLVPMKGSHSFITNISSGNKVEFIFENINLPFDDANNDGYVAFKIKTLPTLVNGDTFSNSASIYFDYNFPIVTNTAITTIQALSNQDFEFSNYFTLYPNPVHDVLHIDGKEAIAISSVSIYNALGQLVVVIPNAQNTKTIDITNLPSGNYFIKVNSDKGTSNTKFIKQ
ncbi:DUF7619 domain-containing protein [Flavobacterium sp. GCM10027622]|uniref:DUF7619 domain-containing protein n=1 Tax=unclassified Flavobacterium TaxID=196869 RepID=UPI0036166F5B